MKRCYSTFALASALTLLVSACSTPEDITQQPTLTPQYGTIDDDSGGQVTATALGQIYVLGRISGYDYEINYTTFSSTFLKRFDTSGRQIWSRKLDQESFGSDDYCGSGAYNVATDKGGKVYAAYGKGSDGGANLKLTKYSAKGTQPWKQTIAASGNQSSKRLWQPRVLVKLM